MGYECEAIHRANSKEGMTESMGYYADRNTARAVMVSTNTMKVLIRSTQTLTYQNEYKVMDMLMIMLERQ